MADLDFYGYERDHAGTYLYSSDVAAIYFDNNGVGSAQRAGLVQNVACSYQHAVLPRFESGSAELYWVTGQSKGDVSVGRLVAYNGLLDGIKPGQGTGNLQNGILGGIHIKIGKMSGAGLAVSLPQFYFCDTSNTMVGPSAFSIATPQGPIDAPYAPS